MKTVFAFLLMSSAALAAETATVIVCPPSLNYCYRDEKPIFTAQEIIDEMERKKAKEDAAVKFYMQKYSTVESLVKGR